MTKRIIQWDQIDIPFLYHTQDTTFNGSGQINCFVIHSAIFSIVNDGYVHECMLRNSNALVMLHPNYIGTKQNRSRPFAVKTLCHASASRYVPDSKVHAADMGPTWILSAPDGTHVGPMNMAIRGV